MGGRGLGRLLIALLFFLLHSVLGAKEVLFHDKLESIRRHFLILLRVRVLGIPCVRSAVVVSPLTTFFLMSARI